MLLLCIMLACLPVRSLAQFRTDSLQLFETRNGLKFIRSGKTLSNAELMNTLQLYRPAYDEMKKARSNKAGVLLGFTGGFLIGWPLGSLIAGQKPQWYLAGIGAGLIGVSIPFDKAYRKHARRSVELFNAAQH